MGSVGLSEPLREGGFEGTTSGAPLLPASWPTWWLSLQQAANAPANLTFGLVCSVILPAVVADIVPAATKGSALGTAAMMGAVAQLLQPVFGAMSDRMRTKALVCGRRRWFIIVAQLLTVCALAVMAVASAAGSAPDDLGSASGSVASSEHPATSSYRFRFWVLACGYTGFQLANCMFCGPMGAIIPELVPQHQQIASGGWSVFWSALSGIAAALLGIAFGEGYYTANETYVILGVLNLAGLVLGVIAFSGKPGCCELEAAPPPLPPPKKLHVQRADSAASALGDSCWRQIVPFLLPFKHTPFIAMFAFLFMQTIAAVVGVYFTQYYLHDTVACSRRSFQLIGFGNKPVVNSALSATSLLSLSQSVASFCMALLGAPLSQVLPGGKRVLIAITSFGMGAGYGAFGFTDDFSVVMACSTLVGACAGLGSPPVFAMLADSLPNTGQDGGKDFNLLVSATALCQIIV